MNRLKVTFSIDHVKIKDVFGNSKKIKSAEDDVISELQRLLQENEVELDVHFNVADLISKSINNTLYTKLFKGYKPWPHQIKQIESELKKLEQEVLKIHKIYVIKIREEFDKFEEEVNKRLKEIGGKIYNDLHSKLYKVKSGPGKKILKNFIESFKHLSVTYYPPYTDIQCLILGNWDESNRFKCFSDITIDEFFYFIQSLSILLDNNYECLIRDINSIYDILEEYAFYDVGELVTYKLYARFRKFVYPFERVIAKYPFSLKDLRGYDIVKDPANVLKD